MTTDDARLWANSRGGRRRPSVAEQEYLQLRCTAPAAMAVYVIQAGQNGPVKIGRVTRVRNLLQRMSALQTGCAEPIYLRRLLATTVEEQLERELHRRFAEYRLEGEWFAPAPHLLEAIRWL